MILLRRLLGDVLREHRREQGRTLREVSAAARVSLGYLSEVERGQKEASSELLGSICEALDVPLSEVLRDVSDNLALAEARASRRRRRPPRRRPAARHQRRRLRLVLLCGSPPVYGGSTARQSARPPHVNGGVDGRSSVAGRPASRGAGSAGTSSDRRSYGRAALLGAAIGVPHRRQAGRPARTPSAPARGAGRRS